MNSSALRQLTHETTKDLKQRQFKRIHRSSPDPVKEERASLTYFLSAYFFHFRAGLPDLLFAKRLNRVQKKEPNSKQRAKKRANHFFQLYQQLQSHMNPYLAIYEEIAMFLNHSCSSTAKQVHDERS